MFSWLKRPRGQKCRFLMAGPVAGPAKEEHLADADCRVAAPEELLATLRQEKAKLRDPNVPKRGQHTCIIGVHVWLWHAIADRLHHLLERLPTEVLASSHDFKRLMYRDYS